MTVERIAGVAAFIATVNPLEENDKNNLRRPILTTTSLQNLNVYLFRRPIVCTRVVYSNRSTILEGDTCIMFPVPTNHCTFFPMHTYRESSRGACDRFLFQTLNIWKIFQQEKKFVQLDFDVFSWRISSDKSINDGQHCVFFHCGNKYLFFNCIFTYNYLTTEGPTPDISCVIR